MKKILSRIVIILLSIYILLCGFFYIFQEKLIFYPQILDKDYTFRFKESFKEINIAMQDETLLNSLLFKANDSKGLIIFLHGNAGALNTWGNLAPFYTNLGYDILFFDYRGFGKSDGEIASQKQLYSDVQLVYERATTLYDESKIVVMGYSIGTGPASYLASQNNPRMLVLLAPYYSLTDVVQSVCPVIPDFLVKYRLETYKYISECKMPIAVFHGRNDEVINYENSINLSKLLTTKDSFIPIDGTGHNDILENKDYRDNITKTLAE